MEHLGYYIVGENEKHIVYRKDAEGVIPQSKRIFFDKVKITYSITNTLGNKVVVDDITKEEYDAIGVVLMGIIMEEE